MELDKPKKIGIGWTNFSAVAMETKKGGFKKFLDSFHQTSWNFVGISTVVCGSFFFGGGGKQFKMAAVAMVTKVQTMLNSLRTVDPFETWQKNRSLKVVLFVFKIFKMAANIKILNIKINCLKFKNEKISMEMDIYMK